MGNNARISTHCKNRAQFIAIDWLFFKCLKWTITSMQLLSVTWETVFNFPPHLYQCFHSFAKSRMPRWLTVNLCFNSTSTCSVTIHFLTHFFRFLQKAWSISSSLTIFSLDMSFSFHCIRTSFLMFHKNWQISRQQRLATHFLMFGRWHCIVYLFVKNVVPNSSIQWVKYHRSSEGVVN